MRRPGVFGGRLPPLTFALKALTGHSMKTIRAGFHGLILVAADLAGIGGGGLLAFRILGVPNQVWLQLPVAIILSVGLFCAWILALRILGWRRLQPGGAKELGGWLAASILWAPLVFLPLHYFTQGYLSSVGNFVALALYQLPVNSLALLAAWLLLRATAPESHQTNALQNGGRANRPGSSGATQRTPSVR